MATPNPDDVEAILLQHFPSMKLMEALAQGARNFAAASGHLEAPNGTASHLGALAEIAAMRNDLHGMPADEIARRASAARAKRQADLKAQAERDAAKKVAKQEAKERQRFYNLPEAMARFALWCKAGFWTVDEAAALLLGRDPQVVTPDSLERELSQGTGLLGFGENPERTEFHRRFDGLRLLLSRVDGVKRHQLKPVEVAAWAMKTQAVELLPELQGLMPPAAVAEKPAQVDETKPAAEAPTGNERFVKRAVLVRLYERDWRTIESDLRHAAENGLAAVAKGAKHGMWDEQAALAWARQNGKVKRGLAQVTESNALWAIGRHLIER